MCIKTGRNNKVPLLYKKGKDSVEKTQWQGGYDKNVVIVIGKKSSELHCEGIEYADNWLYEQFMKLYKQTMGTRRVDSS